MRIGYGFDVHRLVRNRRMVLGGVDIPHSKGLLGHSDADVLCHAISDALLGAAALGDIGVHFPDTNPQFAGISSLLLLKQIAELVRGHHFEVANIDATLVLQKPKVASYIDEMRRNIAEAVVVDVKRVSVKATTTEGLGFAGKEEGVAAHAVVLLQ